MSVSESTNQAIGILSLYAGGAKAKLGMNAAVCLSGVVPSIAFVMPRTLAGDTTRCLDQCNGSDEEWECWAAIL